MRLRGERGKTVQIDSAIASPHASFPHFVWTDKQESYNDTRYGMVHEETDSRLGTFIRELPFLKLGSSEASFSVVVI